MKIVHNIIREPFFKRNNSLIFFITYEFLQNFLRIFKSSILDLKNQRIPPNKKNSITYQNLEFFVHFLTNFRYYYYQK